MVELAVFNSWPRENFPLLVFHVCGLHIWSSCLDCYKRVEANDTVNQSSYWWPLSKGERNYTALGSSSNINFLAKSFKLLYPALDSVHWINKVGVFPTHVGLYDPHPIIEVAIFSLILDRSNGCKKVEAAAFSGKSIVENLLVIRWSTTSAMQPNEHRIMREVNCVQWFVRVRRQHSIWPRPDYRLFKKLHSCTVGNQFYLF